jgi:hypothetical protein
MILVRGARALELSASGVTALVLLVSCGGSPEFLDSRPKLASCGRYTLAEELSPSERLETNKEIACILEAHAEGHPAELIQTVPGEEGGSETKYFRVLGRNRVEVFVDGTELAEPEGWSHSVCAGLRRYEDVDEFYLDATGCRSVALTAKLSPGRNEP